MKLRPSKQKNKLNRDFYNMNTGTVQWVENLKWKGAAKWSASPRTAVVVNNVIEGYRKSYGNLFFYWINRAGHMVNCQSVSLIENSPSLFIWPIHIYA